MLYLVCNNKSFNYIWLKVLLKWFKLELFVKMYSIYKRVGDYLTENELRKLSRIDLLELLLEKSRENEKLQEELDSVKAQLAERNIKIEKAGSIAEAALALNGVFEAAQAAADQYLENLRTISGETSQISDQTAQISEEATKISDKTIEISEEAENEK